VAVIQLVHHNLPHDPHNHHSHGLQPSKIMFTDDSPTNIGLMEGYSSTPSANEEAVGINETKHTNVGVW